MKFDKKKLTALAVAGVMSFGIAGMSSVSYVEAANSGAHYEDGTTNKDSHDMQQEIEKHEQKVKEINAKHRATKDDKQYEKELNKEQKRHDKEMSRLKARYDRHHTSKSY